MLCSACYFHIIIYKYIPLLWLATHIPNSHCVAYMCIYIYLAIVICMFSVVKIKKKKEAWHCDRRVISKKREDGIYALGKAHTYSTPSLRRLWNSSNVFFWLTMALSHPFNATCLVLPLSVPLSSRRWMVEGTLPRLHTTRLVMWLWWRKALVNVWQRGWRHFAKWLCANLSMLFTYFIPSGFVLY